MKLKVIASAASFGVVLLGSLSTLARGQEESTIESLGFLSQNYRNSVGYGVSDDGTVIVGSSNGENNRIRGFRWSTDGGMQELSPESASHESVAYGVSGDGSIVVGSISPEFYYPENRAVYWTATGERFETFVPESWWNSVAYAISGDGLVAVGYADPIRMDTIPHAFRFVAEGEPYDLGSINGNGDRTYANDVSHDGGAIVGHGSLTYNDGRAFRWTPETGIELIGTLQNLDNNATGVSDDGNTVVGYCTGHTGNEEMAFRWTEASGISALPAVDPAGKAAATDVSGDGSIVIGRSDVPSGRSYSTRGRACVWRNGIAYSLWDLLENDYPADLEGWSRLDSAEAISADGTTITGHGIYRGDKSAYRIVLRNEAPTIDAIAPVQIECQGGVNQATLSTTIADDGRRVIVRWKVNGEIVQESIGVEPGQTTLTYDFPHGESLVEVEAVDVDQVGVASTTVVVQDTTAPTLTVTENVVVPTDSRKDFATNLILPPPQVFDLCDGEPALTNDAPERFELGTTTVNWTATDADGNVSTATQSVTVEDRELPRIHQPKDMQLFCDAGKPFATAELVPPEATDNVSDSVVVETKAGPRFRIGKTRVVWTARDEAGNLAKATMFVTVVNRRPTADAGDRVVVEVKKERPARVRLDGRASSDPDGHALKHLWSAPEVVFSDPASERPVGTFPVGATTVKLTVTDEGGAKDSAKVQVVVRLANSQERPRGAAANRAFEAGLQSATNGASTGRASASRLSALAHSQAAALLGVQAGDRVVWEESGSPNDAGVDYATLRAVQAQYGAAAARAWLSAYAEEGDEASLAAATDALRGLGNAQADLIEP